MEASANAFDHWTSVLHCAGPQGDTAVCNGKCINGAETRCCNIQGQYTACPAGGYCVEDYGTQSNACCEFHHPLWTQLRTRQGDMR